MRKLVLFFLTAGLAPAALLDVVKIETGRVKGASSDGVVAFKGIPFAAPPVGALRWKAPQPAANWKGVRKATEFGPRCMQGNIYNDMVFRDKGPSEDCLYLNVWTPAHLARGTSAGDGVDLWRRLRGGRRIRAAAGWREPGQEGRGGGQHELPPGRVRILRRMPNWPRNRTTIRPATTACWIRWRRCNGCIRTSPASAAIPAT